jgi:hypothetical protein
MIALGCRVEGCRLQGEVRYIKVEFEIPNSPARTGNATTFSVSPVLESKL